MKRYITVLALFSLLIGWFEWKAPLTYAFDPKHDVIASHSLTNLHQLIASSDLIAYGSFGEVHQTFKTPHHIQQGALVNFTQAFHVLRPFKGQGIQNVYLFGTEIDPQPQAHDPINLIYTGPLTSENEYVCFFKRLAGTPYYILNGGWSGVYPFINGKTLALADAGITSLDQLTLSELQKKLQEHGL
ncbi:hypothetical protein JOD43_001586 [Pullulanibacillus pueri]|uniref:Uncharacterized protein n=1 Tax=Pullulanibacillus pueri TaxID=1437324 RepID=A0A8J3ELF4_9BACL|nr:hypothetical protein [Pullulanibacillus pueri]MBM7681419.1 hypothetical protein [Pullulanibacillus pueri]GGH78802.1 hypothetical protein GCM10007096_12780 [Pullulanibacillus pueri]